MKKLVLCLAALALCAHAFASPHKIRVNDPAAAKSLLANGGKLIADYGGFQVIEADDAALTGAVTNNIEVRDDENLIRLNVQALDTRTPEVKALRKARGQFAGKRTHMVQFAGPIKPEWREALAHTGARIVTYIPENAYLVYADAAALAQLQSWASNADYVQWEGEYADDYKIHPKARATDAAGNPRDIGTDLFSIQLITDTNANPATLALIDKLKLEPARQDYENGEYHNIVIALPPGTLKQIAAQPDVVSIQPHFLPQKRDERQAQIMAGAVTGGLPTGPGYLSWLASKGFTQAQFTTSGFIVDVADSGVDNGSATPGHFALYIGGDTTKSDRLAYARLEGSPNVGSSLAGCDGHGAINAHIIGGYVDLSGFPHTDSSGYEYDLGICPFVKLGSSVVFDPDNWTSPNYYTLASDAYTSGARIDNNSWGASVGGDYDSDAQTFDQLVRDSQLSVVGNQQMVFVFAAGNEGPCVTNVTHGIDSPGSAKNVITVGAAESVRPITIANGGNLTGGDYCTANSEADSADDVECFSSQGPCTDGRMKPDIVAPGTHITGGVPQVTPPPSSSGTGNAISCFDANGVCGLPGSGGVGNTNNFFPLGQEFYTVSSGTSHATPAVSGACALVRQYFINNSLAAPSPAMTKAFLINSARYLTGVNANDTLWSKSQGMGEVNLGTAFDGVGRVLRDQLSADKFTATGQGHAYSGTIVDSSKPFRVTVAWTDAPGNTTGAAYNNNLDLTVTVGGNVYKGNVFSGQYSTTGGTNDPRNNVESVFLPAGVSGDFTVTVMAANINSDGVPNEAPALDQDFALVIYNATTVTVTNPPPLFKPANGIYNGLFFENSGPELGRSGAIALKTTSAGAYSGTLQLGAARASFTGAFNGLGAATNSILINNTTVTLGMQMNTTNNSWLAGTVKGATWTASMRANRAVFNATTNPAPFAGHYTLVLPGTNDTQFPQGDSYGVVSVDGNGKIKLTGALADGTKLSQSSVASADGLWPLYVPLYKGGGQVLSWLAFTNGGLGGDVSWIKSAIATAKFYPAGFDYGTIAIGSAFVPTTSVLPDFANGRLILTGGNLAGVTNIINLTAGKVTNLSSNKLSLSISATTGQFKGSVLNPATGKSIPFSGVVLQNQDYGSGYFLGTNQSGRVSFGP